MKDFDESDMSDIFRFFRIPTPLYEQWAKYADKTHQTMKSALAELLHYVSNVFIPAYNDQEFKLLYPEITVDQERVCPRAYKEGCIKQFHFKYTPELKHEIFIIFKQTGYKNQTIEINKEICLRLEYALKLIENRGIALVLIFYFIYYFIYHSVHIRKSVYPSFN